MRCATWIAVILLLVCVLWSGGCGFMIASIDVDQALAEAAELNLANVQIAAADKAAVHDSVAGKLDAAFEEKLAASAGGPAAVVIWQAYSKRRVELQTARAADMDQYAEALDNAALISELIERRVALWAGWDAMLGRLPAVGHLRTIAEAEARLYIARLKPG